MTDAAGTEPSTSRGRGRPVGTGYLHRFDAPLVEEVRQMIQPVLLVPTLRDAARAVAPRAHNREYVTEDAAIRRIERYCRDSFST
jgi:hypothetical protein